MELLTRPPTTKLPEQWFTGDAWADVTDDECAGPRVSTRPRP